MTKNLIHRPIKLSKNLSKKSKTKSKGMNAHTSRSMSRDISGRILKRPAFFLLPPVFFTVFVLATCDRFLARFAGGGSVSYQKRISFGARAFERYSPSRTNERSPSSSSSEASSCRGSVGLIAPIAAVDTWLLSPLEPVSVDSRGAGSFPVCERVL